MSWIFFLNFWIDKFLALLILCHGFQVMPARNVFEKMSESKRRLILLFLLYYKNKHIVVNVFISQQTHRQGILHKSIATISLIPWRDSNPGILFLRRIRCPLRHAAKARVYLYLCMYFRTLCLPQSASAHIQHLIIFFLYNQDLRNCQLIALQIGTYVLHKWSCSEILEKRF
jgi:hypothetical protein